MDENYHEVYEFLVFHRYPTGFSKNQKRILRRRSQEHLYVKRGELLYSRIPNSRAVVKRQVDREWRRVVKTVQERKRIILACHPSVEGNKDDIYSKCTAIKCY